MATSSRMPTRRINAVLKAGRPTHQDSRWTWQKVLPAQSRPASAPPMRLSHSKPGRADKQKDKGCTDSTIDISRREEASHVSAESAIEPLHSDMTQQPSESPPSQDLFLPAKHQQENEHAWPYLGRDSPYGDELRMYRRGLRRKHVEETRRSDSQISWYFRSSSPGPGEVHACTAICVRIDTCVNL
jgi:hypothetical protein